MIRCYEAKLSKNLNPRVRSFIMKEWMEKRNTYGIELKKYIIDSSSVDQHPVLGLYIKDQKVFGDSILVDNNFSERLLGRHVIYFLNSIKEKQLGFYKRRILNFYPVNYEESIFSENKMRSKLVKVIGMFGENNYNVLGIIYGDVYQVRENYRELFYNIWNSKVNGNYEKPINLGKIEI